MISLSRRTIVSAASLLPLAAVVTPAAFAQEVNQDAFTEFASDGRFSDWMSLLVESGLSPYARGLARFTAFVPTNQAFAGNPGVLASLLPNGNEAFPDTTKLIRFIRAHVLAGMHPLSEFSGKEVTVNSVIGTPIEIDARNPSSIQVTWTSMEGVHASTKVSGAPIACINALIYPVDQVVVI